ncbi:MAG TPA: hypothetical protein VLL54_12890 [Pyrinomonadaceae bacterium]|nr:hypothetical protein [Pyrinomonadaceae bacterium]
MFETRFFSINRLLKEYGEEHHDSRDDEFKIRDVIDARSFAKKLTSRGDNLSNYLCSKFSPQTFRQLQECAASESGCDSAFLRALVRDLNGIIRGTNLYEERRFKGVVLSSAPARIKDDLKKMSAGKRESRKGITQTRLNRLLLEEAYPQELANSQFELNKIQMVNQPGYEYVKDRSNKYFYLQCLLHGAAKRKPQSKLRRARPLLGSGSFEDSVQDFLVKDLQLLFGMYCFVDPRASDEDDAPPFYLLGSFSESDLKPSFTFPMFVNARNIRNNREFLKLPDEWLSFYLNVNTVTREHILNFKDDFVKFFAKHNWRRNKKLEQKNNLFYASSGEIDHTILQWLVCGLGTININVGLRKKYAISLSRLFRPEDKLGKCVDYKAKEYRESLERHKSVIDKIVTKENGEFYLGPNQSGVLKATTEEWLERFGLLMDRDRRVPTERLLAAVEFLYFHLKNWEQERIGFNTSNYFSLQPGRGYYHDALESGDSACYKAVGRFIDSCEANLPVMDKRYDVVMEELGSDLRMISKLNEVLENYFSVLNAVATFHRGSQVHFAGYGRFNIPSHFFQRNILPLYNPLLKEQTCRGFIIIPIFSNPHALTKESLKDVGYFLGLIKDSDAKGRCYFNWRTHSDNATESETTDFFYNEYLFHLQNFVYNLGFKEVKQIYYKGIENRHNNEIKQQASRAAISQVMARNMSHNVGSHVLSRYKSTVDFSSKTINGPLQYLGEKMSVNRLLSSNRSEDKTDGAAIQRAYFNEYLKNRMDFLADVATTDPTLESDLYLLKDVLAAFDKNRILLDRISGLDSNIEFDIAVSFKEKRKLHSLRKEKDPNDQLLAIPNDILGCQAFYIIIENIIRNVTKHSKVDERAVEGKPLKFLITVVLEKYRGNPGYYEVSIYDDFYRSASSMAETVAKRNELIASPVLDERKNRLRDVGLGTVEMVVCAAYLRRVPLDLIEDEFYRLVDERYAKRDRAKIPNVIYAYPQPHKTKRKQAALGYKFYIRIPQKLLVFDDDHLLGLDDKELNACRANGITIIETKKFREEWEYSHDFLIWLNDKASFDRFYDPNKTKLPQRILTKEQLGDDLRLEDLDRQAWERYLLELFRRKNVSGFSVTRGTSGEAHEFPPDVKGDRRKVFIDEHHGEWFDYEHKTDVYYEMCCSHHRLNKLIFKRPLDLMRYLESVVTRVIIIDERVQANLAIAKYADQVPLKDYFEKMGVFVPSKSEVNLNKLNFVESSNDNVEKKLRDYLTSKLVRQNQGRMAVDFCVLHLGIIEKLFGNRGSVTNDMIKDKISWLVGGDENLDKVIITTGRGKPTNISPKFRYIPLAIIQSCVETLFDKGMLVTALYNARRSK